MKYCRRLTFVFSAILTLTTAVHADMIQISQQDAELLQTSCGCESADIQSHSLFYPYNHSYVADFDTFSYKFSPEGDINVKQTFEKQNLHVLTDGRDSMKFCLSALISLGLFCSTHWVKRLSLGFIPEWYHQGGPFQIGHSQALMPGALCPIQTHCFIQPDSRKDNHLPQYFIKTVISLWRKSQFTHDVIASRGPPIS